ncbi:transposase, partial [Novosphingobium sp. Rr 2-17]
MRRDRRDRLKVLQTGDGRPLTRHVEAQILRELDRLELIMEQIKAVEMERDALISDPTAHAPASLLMHLRGIGPESGSFSSR